MTSRAAGIVHSVPDLISRCTRLTCCLIVAGSASAQELPIRSGSSCQFDTTAFRDTAQYTLFLSPPFRIPEASKRPKSYTPYIMAIASTFEQPQRLTLGSWPGTSVDRNGADKSCGADSWCDVGPWDGEIEFQVGDEQRLKGIEWRLHPDSPEAILALETAVRRADSLRLMPAKPKIAGLPPGAVRLGLRLTRDQPPVGGVPIGRIRLPYIRVTTPVRIIHQPKPRFPARAAAAGATGVVRLQYVVAEDGHVPQESIRVLEAEPRGFIAPSLEAILGSRFMPAKAGDCPVKLLVQQRVRFLQR